MGINRGGLVHANVLEVKISGSEFEKMALKDILLWNSIKINTNLMPDNAINLPPLITLMIFCITLSEMSCLNMQYEAFGNQRCKSLLLFQ